MGKPNSLPPADHYSANYANFQTELYAQIRHEAFGEDIGQNSWLTSDEQDRFLAWLELSPGKTLLDVACGAGGPALRIAATTGCSVVGIDVHEQAVSMASSLAAQQGLAERAKFRAADATGPLPFSNASFDAITCIDAINHFPDRPRVIAEWARLLKMGGRLLFTDPITLTGPLTLEGLLGAVITTIRRELLISSQDDVAIRAVHRNLRRSEGRSPRCRACGVSSTAARARRSSPRASAPIP